MIILFRWLQVTFVAEQVSHHPPISAFYAEHPAAGVTCTAHIYTKSSFLGLSIGVSMIGRATVKLLEVRLIPQSNFINIIFSFF